METANENYNKEVCPECGAIIKNRRSCQLIFDEFLVKEFTDPEFGAVHFITVACFMIQHRRYSNEALKWIASKLRDYLEKGLSADDIRARANREISQENRRWKVKRAPQERSLPVIAWSRRISDVKYSDNDAAAYRREITEWASSILEEMQVWLKADSSG